MHSLIHSCYGNRSLGGVLRASGWASCLWVLLRAPCPKGVTRRSHGGRTAGLPQGHTPGEKNPKKGALTKQKCSSLLSQGHLPGLTHVGIVETPGDEAPLCPEPPCTRGVTTIAPGGRGSSCSPAIPSGDRQGDGASLAWLKESFGHIKPFFFSLFLSLQGFAFRHQGKNTHGSKSQSASLPGP